MNVLAFKKFGGNNLTSCTQNTKVKEKEEKLLKLENYGKQLLIPKFRQELLTCFTKMPAIENQISKILEQLNLAIYALRLLNTHRNRKWLFVT